MPLEVQTLTYAAIVNGHYLRWQESLEYGLRATELSTGDENPSSDVWSRFWTLMSLIAMGDLDGARPHALVMRDLLVRRSAPQNIAIFGSLLIMALSWFEGDWKAGRESSDRSLELSPLNTLHLTVGNQHKWDRLGPEKIIIMKSSWELPEGLVVASSLF